MLSEFFMALRVLPVLYAARSPNPYRENITNGDALERLGLRTKAAEKRRDRECFLSTRHSGFEMSNTNFVVTLVTRIWLSILKWSPLRSSIIKDSHVKTAYLYGQFSLEKTILLYPFWKRKKSSQGSKFFYPSMYRSLWTQAAEWSNFHPRNTTTYIHFCP